MRQQNLATRSPDENNGRTEKWGRTRQHRLHPVYLSNNGRGYATRGDIHLNVKPGYLDDYADFLVEVLEHFQQQGQPFDYLSPVNEPQWNWDEPGWINYSWFSGRSNSALAPSTLPVRIPCWNQRARCWDVPCVNESGTT